MADRVYVCDTAQQMAGDCLKKKLDTAGIHLFPMLQAVTATILSNRFDFAAGMMQLFIAVQPLQSRAAEHALPRLAYPPGGALCTIKAAKLQSSGAKYRLRLSAQLYSGVEKTVKLSGGTAGRWAILFCARAALQYVYHRGLRVSAATAMLVDVNGHPYDGSAYVCTNADTMEGVLVPCV